MKTVLRCAIHDDLPAIAVADGRAFGIHHSEQKMDDFRLLFEPDRFLLACDADDGQVVGVTGDFPFTMTLPGGGALAVPGVAWVSVIPTHRRRGVLRTMLAAQHRRFIEDGVAVSILTASEGGIYGRFGYGPAITRRAVKINRRLTAFRPGAPDPGGVRHVEADEARKHAPDVHQRWCTITPGALSRSPAWWDYQFLDREDDRGEESALFHLVHPDGWAAYRIDDDEQRCRVVELVAATDEAHVALWRVLLGLDLVRTVTTGACPMDDPLPFLLADPRRVRTVGLTDGVWARLLDVPAALSARRYSTEVDVTIEVHDAFLDRGGRFRLRGGPDGACCDPTERMPDAHAEIAALGSLYLGGHRAVTLARAGLVQVTDPVVMSRVDAAFTADRSPQFGTEF
ncbi:MAG TPA: GNAT family N-acetyltransferase [Pseudonocardiaceae bacterium]|nr:GNAT family N-acetyltransferase [Pseudonocardiaceae bacterium]